MNCVRVKDGVRFATIAPGGFHILAALDTVAERLHRDLEITSGTDSHALPDPHAWGGAYDISVRGFDVPTICMLVVQLRGMLGPGFTAFYESPTPADDPRLFNLIYTNPHATAPHVHVQVKNGSPYPPVGTTSERLA